LRSEVEIRNAIFNLHRRVSRKVREAVRRRRSYKATKEYLAIKVLAWVLGDVDEFPIELTEEVEGC